MKKLTCACKSWSEAGSAEEEEEEGEEGEEEEREGEGWGGLGLGWVRLGGGCVQNAVFYQSKCRGRSFRVHETSLGATKSAACAQK